MTAEEEFPLFPFRADARKTGVATLDLMARGTIEAGFIPAQMLADGSTEPLRPSDPRAGAIVDYMTRITAQSGFDTRFEQAERDGWAHLRALPSPA
jgi:poly-gamma-glutamate synthesis protein (capsule biosynthesis protein)